MTPLTPLALIPGWGFDQRIWQPVVDLLAADFAIHHLDRDRPGTVPADAIVCGWSLGAMTAMRLALDQPERVARLVLVGATPRFVQAPDWEDAATESSLVDFAAAVQVDPMATLRRFAGRINQGDAHAAPLTRRLAALLADRRPDTAVLATGLARLRDTDLRKSVAAIRQPTLLVHGERDAIMPVEAACWLADHLPDARLEIFLEASHAPFLSEPARFAALLRQFARDE
ncbi:MAG: alpha/beta fold hydrolase [Rhodocyclaceae bacterium]|nr:alpha/beta fold hydrolase [Rhodocyclaceae bacterium]